MKKLIFLTIFLIPLLLNVVSAQSCLTSSEDFAVEAVFTDYNLFNLRQIVQETKEGFIFPSEYNPEILTIIKETEFPQGLSVKLQIPTKRTEVTNPHLKLVSSSISGELKEINLGNFGLWQISCEENSCTFEKDKRRISYQEIGSEKELSIEIQESLPACTDTCSGLCFSAFSGSKCIDSRMKKDIETLLKFYGIINNFEEIFDSYRIVGSEEITITDLQPVSSPYINWIEAMRQEIVFLSNNGVLDLTRDDIESIAALSKKGQAGQNYRIVENIKTGEWNYYDKTENPILTSQRDCTEYSKITGSVIQLETNNEIEDNLFYVVPLVILGSGLVLLLILIIIGRSLSRDRRRKFTKEQEINF